MKVLWITNMLLPPVARALGLKESTSGGWLYASLQKLRATYPDVRFAVLSLYGSDSPRTIDADGVAYHLMPASDVTHTAYERAWEKSMADLNSRLAPDVVHIHGTEYPFGMAWLNACGSGNVLVSVQGLVSVISRYYLAGIDRFPLTFRDLLRHDTPRRQQKKFERRGRYEEEMLGKALHVAGRTTWDRAHVAAINPSATYHHCGESLRASFYGARWSYGSCRPCSIFVSQGSYPLKGLHKVVEALPTVLRSHPTATVRVAGEDPVNVAPWRRSGYGEYLRRLIRDKSLGGNIEFLGSLDEKAMLEAYLGANIFVCPSSIENSSNSVAEAVALGLPVMASFVGGMADILPPQCLYRFEETEMLAQGIIDIFDMKDKAAPAGSLTQSWDPARNAAELMSVYNKIIHSWR